MVHGVQQLAAAATRSSVAGLSDSERSSIAASYRDRLRNGSDDSDAVPAHDMERWIGVG
jgi:hypothetical protein